LDAKHARRGGSKVPQGHGAELAVALAEYHEPGVHGGIGGVEGMAAGATLAFLGEVSRVFGLAEPCAQGRGDDEVAYSRRT